MDEFKAQQGQQEQQGQQGGDAPAHPQVQLHLPSVSSTIRKSYLAKSVAKRCPESEAYIKQFIVENSAEYFAKEMARAVARGRDFSGINGNMLLSAAATLLSRFYEEEERWLAGVAEHFDNHTTDKLYTAAQKTLEMCCQLIAATTGRDGREEMVK